MKLSNVRRLVAPITYMVLDIDDMIDVDTSSGGLTTLYIPNIIQNGYDQVPKKIYVNDISNNASVGKITVVCIGGNTINNQPSIDLDVDGISAEIEIADRTRWLANLNTDDSGGGLSSVAHDSSLFGNGTLLNPLGVQGYYNNNLFVSPNGNDITATVGRNTLPYKNIETARDVVRNLVNTVGGNYLIYVYAGNHTVNTPLNSPNTSYYFQSQAIVTHDNSWILDDTSYASVLADNTKILGYGTFLQQLNSGTFNYGFSNSSIATTNWEIEFETLIGNSGLNFTGSYGKQNINGKYLRNKLQYVLVGYNECLWNIKINEVENRTGDIFVVGDTGAGSFIFVQLIPPIGQLNAVSYVEVDKLFNNANNSFATIQAIACSNVDCKVVVKANIFHDTGTVAPSFIGVPLGTLFGGILEFEGTIKSNGGVARIYGGDNTATSILINDSVCEHKATSIADWRPAIKVNNSNHWITIKDSLISTQTPVACSVGVPLDFGDNVEEGNLQIVNSVIQNVASFIPPTPSVNIQTNKLLGKILLDDVTLIIQNTEPSYSIKSANVSVPQTISILSGGVTATNDVEPTTIGAFASTILADTIIPADGTVVTIGARTYTYDGIGVLWNNLESGFIYANIGDAINGDTLRVVNATPIIGVGWTLTAIIMGVSGNAIITDVNPVQVGFSVPSATLTGGIDALGVSNTIIGTNLILANQTLTNPYIK